MDMHVRMRAAFLADISTELWLCDCSLKSPFRTFLINVGIDDWLISLSEARRKSTVIVEVMADDACSTRRANSAWEKISTSMVSVGYDILST